MTYQEGDLLKDQHNEPLQLLGLENYTQLVYVAAGSFNIGDNNSGIKEEKEAPITFKKGYFIGQYAVTQQLYEAVMGQNPSEFKGKYRPVEMVSWNDICTGDDAFLAQLNQKVAQKHPELKGQFALPSEAQWEYAARGGTKWNKTRFYYSGSHNIKDVAWYKDNANDYTFPVGLKQPNALGLYDMSGNVWEWCADWYVDDYKEIPFDGTAFTKLGINRVLRGGAYSSNSWRCLESNRGGSRHGDRNNFTGFRLVFHSLESELEK